MQLAELNDLIIQWAKDKGILSKAKVIDQAEKTAEEVKELIEAIIWMKSLDGQVANMDVAICFHDSLVDAIGDVYVTLTIGMRLHGTFMPDWFASTSVEKPVEELQSSLVKMGFYIGKDSYAAVVMHMAGLLIQICCEYGLTLEQCVESAYDVISKRTGKMVDGKFVKDQA